MIYANQLRVGNWLINEHIEKGDHPLGYFQVGAIDRDRDGFSGWFIRDTTHRMVCSLEEDAEDPFIKPIELTPEILEAAGFVNVNHIHGYSFYNFQQKNRPVIRIYDSKTEVHTYILNNHVKYLHQLQNLYFALTGEELTIKEIAPTQ